jgi:hypothetical protein
LNREFFILFIECIELRVNGRSLNYAYDDIWFSSICISWVIGMQARGKILGTLAVGEENGDYRLLLFLAGGVGGVGGRGPCCSSAIIENLQVLLCFSACRCTNQLILLRWSTSQKYKPFHSVFRALRSIMLIAD